MMIKHLMRRSWLAIERIDENPWHFLCSVAVVLVLTFLTIFAGALRPQSLRAGEQRSQVEAVTTEPGASAPTIATTSRR
jgi:hypothetical protein